MLKHVAITIESGELALRERPQSGNARHRLEVDGKHAGRIGKHQVCMFCIVCALDIFDGDRERAAELVRKVLR